MATSRATTVDGYLEELPPDRRAVIATVRDTVRKALPKGYRETVNWGMITYELPLERYPDTYNGQPLMYAALAAQKNHYAIYLTGLYQDPDEERRFRAEYEKTGRKLDMGKSCLRFRKLDDLPLDLIGRTIASTPPEKFIARYEASRRKG